MHSNIEELFPICPGCPNHYLCIKVALLLMNSLTKIEYIKVPRIDTLKYKESKSSSHLLKMPSCFSSSPQEPAHLEQTTGQRDAVKAIALNTQAVIHPQGLTAHRISLL